MILSDIPQMDADTRGNLPRLRDFDKPMPLPPAFGRCLGLCFGSRAALRAAISIGVMWVVSVALGYSQAPPLPPKRPPDLGPESRMGAAPGVFPKVLTPAPPDNGQLIPQSGIEECVKRLSALGVNVQAENAPHDNNDACFVAMPIRIKHLTARYGLGSGIQFPNQPLIDCRLAEPLARWLGEVVAPVFAANFSSPLTAVRTGPGYECRNRNHEETGKISAHAIGLALDIFGFELANGQIVSVESKNDPVSEAVLRTIRIAGCGWFTTILGPGSDAAHANHLHVDVLQHGSDNRYRICE
jgi:hypothetical protein